MQWLKLALLFFSSPVLGQQLSFALEQINAQAIVEAGLTGRGVKIGIIDGGFMGADRSVSLNSIFHDEQVAGYRDYLHPKAPQFSGKAALNDTHGTEVWELIGGYHKSKNILYGLATGATYYLARTDHGGYEQRKEEKYAIQAMKWMAKNGVQIINFSLGYNYGYSHQEENYHQKQIDGRSTILTQAIDSISKAYGILFIVAAGNDGDHPWQILGSPADAQMALTVGATKFKIWDAMDYTSKGPEWLPYVKPEIACYSSLGTSFSAPVITGLAACLLEKEPDITASKLKQIITQSAHLAYPNNHTGYGVPNAAIALQLLQGIKIKPSTTIQCKKKSFLLELKKPSIYLAIYHKNGWLVMKEERLLTNKKKIRIRRKENATSSTAMWERGAIEVIWDR